MRRLICTHPRWFLCRLPPGRRSASQWYKIKHRPLAKQLRHSVRELPAQSTSQSTSGSWTISPGVPCSNWEPLPWLMIRGSGGGGSGFRLGFGAMAAGLLRKSLSLMFERSGRTTISKLLYELSPVSFPRIVLSTSRPSTPLSCCQGNRLLPGRSTHAQAWQAYLIILLLVHAWRSPLRRPPPETTS